MRTKNEFAELDARGDDDRIAPIVSETYWGYVIRPSETMLERAALIEMVSMFSGILVFLAAYGQWLLPGADYSADLLPFKLALTIIFAALGGSLVWIARVGMVQELQVDRTKGELRLVQRNRQGEAQLIEALPFHDVAGVRIGVPRLPFLPDRLVLRTASGRTIELLPSDRNRLLPLRDRLASELSPRLAGAEAGADTQTRRRTA